MREDIFPTEETTFDTDKYHEQKAREMFQRFLMGRHGLEFPTAETMFVAGFVRGVDYGKATFDKRRS